MTPPVAIPDTLVAALAGVIHTDLAGGPTRERFLREIRAAATLQHQNLLPVFDSGEAGGRLFYTMPFVAGESFRDRLRREAQLPLDDAIRIALETAEALAVVHQGGWVHRDIEPENIMLSAGHPWPASSTRWRLACYGDGGGW